MGPGVQTAAASLCLSVCDSQHQSDMSAVNTLTTLHYSESCQLGVYSIYTISGLGWLGVGLKLSEGD